MKLFRFYFAIICCQKFTEYPPKDEKEAHRLQAACLRAADVPGRGVLHRVRVYAVPAEGAHQGLLRERAVQRGEAPHQDIQSR